MVDPGNIVKTDDTILTTIVSLDPVYVYFDIDERTMLALERFSQKTGTPVPWKTDTLPRSNASATGLAFGAKVVTQKTSAPRFFGLKTAGLVGGGGALPWKFGMPVALGLADEDAYPHNGTINFADNVVNRQTGTLRVRGEFDNPTKLLQSGMFCRVRVPIGGAHDAVLVADKALSTDQSRKYLFVLDSNNKASQRDVKVGALHGSLRVVEGVGRDERVVVEGLQRVKAGSEVAPKLTDMIQTKGTREPVVVTNQAGGEKSSTK
jgi:multidrug efflux pump subunit AcrA (membrane-fusion protein)